MKRILNFLLGFGMLFVLSSAFSSNASAAELLTLDEKTQYYQEYQKIVDELREEYPDADFTLLEFKDFGEQDWVEQAKFRENIVTILEGGINFVVQEQQEFTTLSSGGAGPTPTKYVDAYSSNGTYLGQVVVNATVTTKYDSSVKGQVITGITNVSSYTMHGLSHWSQSSARGSKETNQKWNLKLTGNFHTGGVSYPQAFDIPYRCTNSGTIY